jgi:uncharacterized linocin/CFP29 family protein
MQFQEIANPARVLMGQMSVHAMRPYIDRDGVTKIVGNDGRGIQTNAVGLLQYDEWKDLDRRVIEIATQRLVAVGDLISRGLTHNLGSIGQTISQWERSSDMTGANIDMTAEAQGEEDTPAYDYKAVPVPIVHKDFRINLRRLAASRLVGEGVDVLASDIAARVVAEKSEDMLLSGSAIQVDGNTIYGYTNHPDRNTVTLALAWDNAAITGPDILADVQAMITAAKADRYYGPYTLYVPQAYEQILDNDYNPGTADTRTIKTRLLQLSELTDIKVVDRLAANNVLLIQMQREVVDWAIAQDVSTVQWQVNGTMQERFKVMAVWAPRVKSDFDGHSGIVHLS